MDKRRKAGFRHTMAVMIGVICILVTMGAVNQTFAGNKALEQLLQIFEKKGGLTAKETQAIRDTIKKEETRFQERDRSLMEREQHVLERERALLEKEAEAGPVIASPVEEKLEAAAWTEADHKAKAPGDTTSEKAEQRKGIPLEVSYRDGFRLSTKDPDDFSLTLGGLLQVDYRYFRYENEDPNKNRFDIRRARLIMKGRILRHFDYKFQYEFSGAGSRRLLDAYVDVNAIPYASFRVGQYKSPFSFEQVTPDSNLFFAERSMGFYLTPGRDLGLMAHHSLWDDRFNYGIGFFNGDGPDDTVGGDVDSPQVIGRVVASPFKHLEDGSFIQGLQFGGSGSYGNIDRNNVQATIRTTGLTKFFDVASSAKFAIVRDVDKLTRYGAELAWPYGPFLLSGEYIKAKFSGVQTSSNRFDVGLRDYYVSFLWMVTGENPVIQKGVLQPMRPKRSLWQGGWGAFGLAFRYDSFEADPAVYQYLVEPGDSVRKATGYSFAVNWWMNPYARLLIDLTRTKFDRPLLIMRDSMTGTSIYSEWEDVVTARLQFQY